MAETVRQVMRKQAISSDVAGQVENLLRKGVSVSQAIRKVAQETGRTESAVRSAYYSRHGEHGGRYGRYS